MVVVDMEEGMMVATGENVWAGNQVKLETQPSLRPPPLSGVLVPTSRQSRLRPLAFFCRQRPTSSHPRRPPHRLLCRKPTRLLGRPRQRSASRHAKLWSTVSGAAGHGPAAVCVFADDRCVFPQ